MTGRWDQPGIPHKGWRCIAVTDRGDDASPGEELDYATCEMCGNERIRFVHSMEHDDYSGPLDVGCVCAEKMSDDYAGPRRREERMKKRAGRRARWLHRRWRESSKGNDYLNVDGHNIVVFRLWQAPSKCAYSIDGEISRHAYPTEEAAKIAAFDEYWLLVEDQVD